MSVRKVVFWSHLVVATVTGLVVLVLAVTGALLAYERQIVAFAESRFDVVASDAPRLGADELATIALVETGGAASGLVFENRAEAPVTATAGRDGKVLLDPVTGAALGEGVPEVDAFFSTVEQIHRWFALSGEGRAGAKAIVDAVNLAFLFLLVTGAFLWWPRKLKWRVFRNNLLFRRNLPTAKARDYNWHHVLGAWAFVPLVLIVASGVVMSYPWASNLVYAAYGEQPEAGGRRPPSGGGSGWWPESGADLQAVLEGAEAYDPAWNTITLAFPRSADATTVNAVVDTGTGRQPARQTTLTFDLADGARVSSSGIEDRSPAERARIFLRFLHTGEVYGLVGQGIAALASLAAAVLVYTGLALAWRRLVSPVFARRRTARTAT